jgi:hypothetical protein
MSQTIMHHQQLRTEHQLSMQLSIMHQQLSIEQQLIKQQLILEQ